MSACAGVVPHDEDDVARPRRCRCGLGWRCTRRTPRRTAHSRSGDGPVPAVDQAGGGVGEAGRLGLGQGPTA